MRTAALILALLCAGFTPDSGEVAAQYCEGKPVKSLYELTGEREQKP